MSGLQCYYETDELKPAASLQAQLLIEQMSQLRPHIHRPSSLSPIALGGQSERDQRIWSPVIGLK